MTGTATKEGTSLSPEEIHFLERVKRYGVGRERIEAWERLRAAGALRLNQEEYLTPPPSTWPNTRTRG